VQHIALVQLTNDKKTLIVLLGPTASGKTELGIELAQWLGTEIVSADSRQVYKEMNIGTAKPSFEQLQSVPHHLIGHVSIFENYNAGRFEREALECLAGLFKTHLQVLLVGGTGLYIKALCSGLDELPESDPATRQELVTQYSELGIGYLQDELKKHDPAYYDKVDLQNPARLMRALEVFRVTGKPFSSFRSGRKGKREFDIVKIGLDIPRPELVRRIDQRVLRMVESGLVDEVRSLAAYRSFNAMNTVGYQEILDYLDGTLTLEEAIQRIQINTRRYAKRQMTWFRKDEDIRWFSPGSGEDIKNYLQDLL
jgi:tRNA dimethylallyltransferase